MNKRTVQRNCGAAAAYGDLERQSMGTAVPLPG
jgi:hypothetical protein